MEGRRKGGIDGGKKGECGKEGRGKSIGIVMRERERERERKRERKRERERKGNICEIIEIRGK